MRRENTSSGDYVKESYSPQTEERPSTQQQSTQQKERGGSTGDQGGSTSDQGGKK